MKFKITLFIILGLFVGVVYYLTAGYYSKGERAGTISKLSERGYVFKNTSRTRTCDGHAF